MLGARRCSRGDGAGSGERHELRFASGRNGGGAIGVTMTPEMVSEARRNQADGGYSNAEFRLWKIESLPVVNDSVAVIIHRLLQLRV